MKTALIYLAGVVTPFVVMLICTLIGEVNDWRARRRYQRAWDKFSAEFASLTPEQLATCRAQWDAESWKYDHFASDEGRYFTMRWQHGRTTEV